MKLLVKQKEEAIMDFKKEVIFNEEDTIMDEKDIDMTGMYHEDDLNSQEEAENFESFMSDDEILKDKSFNKE